MRRYLLLAFLAVSAFAANIKLYLKDGDFHVVREYKVEGDRVRYYSIERSDWEEIPLSLVDLKKTESEASTRQELLDKESKALSEEEASHRAMQKEVSRIPQDPGVYWMDGNRAKPIKAAEASVKTNKGRSVLAKLSPIPAVSGKGTLEVQGLHSENVFTNREQEFYFQLSDTERFGMIKLTPKNGVRIVENLTFVPITKEVVEEMVTVPTFQLQLADGGLYKIWPKEPLEPGEYAVVEYTDGKLNIQVFDFSISAK